MKLKAEMVIITEKSHFAIKEKKDETEERRLTYWLLPLNNSKMEYKTIAFPSRVLDARVTNFLTNDLEFLAVVWAARHISLYIWVRARNCHKPKGVTVSFFTKS